MDSMRSLNTSLPKMGSPRKAQMQASDHLNQAFKDAALSVTNLYKAALSSEQARAHSEGYQAAVGELLSFLDNENLGLGDGEGWRVRQWATERLPSTAPFVNDSDEDNEPEDARARSSSPVMERGTTTRHTPPAIQITEPSESTAPPIVPEATTLRQPTSGLSIASEPTPRQSEFTFTTNQQMDTDDQPATNNQPTTRFDSSHSRYARASRRRSHGSRTNLTTQTPLGAGAGHKRRMEVIPEQFFDFSSIGGKDVFGPNKRNRFS